jgi:hypothetical protein
MSAACQAGLIDLSTGSFNWRVGLPEDYLYTVYYPYGLAIPLLNQLITAALLFHTLACYGPDAISVRREIRP